MVGLSGKSRDPLELDLLCNSRTNERREGRETKVSSQPSLPSSLLPLLSFAKNRVDGVLTSLLLSLPLKSSVPLNSGNELLSALGVLDVLDSEVDPLLEVSVSDDLEADDSDSSGRDVVNDTGLSVVELVEVRVGAEVKEVEERRKEGKVRSSWLVVSKRSRGTSREARREVKIWLGRKSVGAPTE